MARLIDLALLLSGCTLALYWSVVCAQERQVQMFVNVYDHPKTGFSCKDKAPGAYYADPESKCAVYFICIPNPSGSLTPQSFACPNGTIFSQATKVCRPHEEVYCQLASRYYGSSQGHIDEKEVFEPLPIPVAVPVHVQPVSPRRQSPPRTAPKPQPPVQPLAAAPPQPQPAPQPRAGPPANSNLFNGNNRFRNSRVFPVAASPSSTTTKPSTTSTPAPPPPPPPPAAGPALGDYEYDYGDFNETGNANAASSLHAQIIENVAEAIAKDIAKTESEKKVGAESKSSRRKRETDSWMLSRRKGQLMEAVSDLSTLTIDDALLPTPSASVSFTCEDKIAGLPYADISSDCNKFHLCVSVAKGKLWSYHLSCDEGKRFNQALGMCDSALDDKACARSERYYAYNKWHKASKKHFLDSAKKLSAHQ